MIHQSGLKSGRKNLKKKMVENLIIKVTFQQGVGIVQTEGESCGKSC